EFGIEFYANGTFGAYGTESRDDKIFEFQSEGAWETQGTVISATGPELSGEPVNAPGLVFAFSGAMQPDGSLSYLKEGIEPSQGRVSDRSVWACQRRN